jgi:ABC-type branched-subunit amino acid transport system substrate-binding protein
MSARFADGKFADREEVPRSMSRRAALRTRTAAVAVLTAVLTVSTACLGGSTSAGPTPCPAAAGVSPDQVTLGVIYPTTGPDAATYAPYRTGIDARLGLANAQGGVYGRQIQYTWADDGGDATQNLNRAQRLVSESNIFALQEFSPSPQGSAAWLNRAGVPVVGTSDDLVWSQYRNMFSYFNLITGTGGSITTWGDYARSQNTHKAAVLVAPLSQGSEALGTEIVTSMRAVGIPAETVVVDPANLNLPGIVNRIKATGADLVTGVVDATTFFQIMRAMRAADPTIKILSVDGYDSAVLAIGRELKGMSVFSDFLPFETPTAAHRTFLDAMALYAPEQQEAANEIALTGWIDTDLFLRGLQAAGPCPTRQAFMTNLRAVSNYTAGGLLASPVNLNTVFGQLTLCYSFLRISSDGERFVPVGDKPLCGTRLP